MKALPYRWLVWGAAGLAAVSIGIAAARLPARFAGESGLPRPSAPRVPEDAGGADYMIDTILALSPFGRAAPPGEDAPAAATTLGLTLHGVVIATSPEASRAILSDPSGTARSYGVGQDVPAGAVLAEVYADHVVLLVDGRLETLAFPEDHVEQDAGVAALRALVSGTSNEPAPDASAADPDDVIAGYRERIHDDPQAVLDELGLVATDAGYRVAAGVAESVLRVGLQPEDLVTKVNGQQVGNIEQDRSLFDNVTASGRVSMEVERNGQRIVMSFPLK